MQFAWKQTNQQKKGIDDAPDSAFLLYITMVSNLELKVSLPIFHLCYILLFNLSMLWVSHVRKNIQ